MRERTEERREEWGKRQEEEGALTSSRPRRSRRRGAGAVTAHRPGSLQVPEGTNAAAETPVLLGHAREQKTMT